MRHFPCLLAATQSIRPTRKGFQYSQAQTPVSSSTTLKNGQGKAKGTSTVLPTEGAPRVRRAVKSKVEDRVGIQAPSIGNFTFTAVLKNTMTMGRKYELEEIGGRNFALKNELVLGIKHKSGWGFSIADDIRQTNNNDHSKDKRNNITDASLILSHPAIVKNESMSLGGYLRPYLPTSNRSQDSGFRQLRYYSFLDITMPAKWGLSNLMIPMFFTDNAKKAEDADFLFYESLELTHQTAKTVRFGFGQQTQYEHHRGTPSGTTVEVYPFVDIEIIPNVLIEPKFYLPVFVQNLVDGAPAAVSLAQSQAELYIKMGF
ncbi:MAG: hypothetical protein EOP05_06060 [Proteobacteria bacterium]|nr:MAG: hypothetical protein EOP05_06060 [Pseudomonadota bacterium]